MNQEITSAPPTGAAWRLLANHLGYEAALPKKAVIDTAVAVRLRGFRLVVANGPAGLYATTDPRAGRIALEGPLPTVGQVDGWRGYYFHHADFSELRQTGWYALEVQAETGEWVRLGQLEIGGQILERRSLDWVLGSFKLQRASGRFDRTDRAVPLFGHQAKRVDAHGGWYDASGDTSKYLTHLSYANHFNPQQTPMAVWNFLEAHDCVESRQEAQADQVAGEAVRLKYQAHRLLDEASHGADWLLRMLSPEGYFYTTVFDQWSKDLDERMVCAYATRQGIRSERCQAAWRQGGGVAIAALARLSRHESHGQFSPGDYLAGAIRAFDHLQVHNAEYLPDGQENIIDDYCALLAALELAAATGDGRFRAVAGQRGRALCARLSSGYGFSGWFRGGADDSRPYFHAAEAGLPLIALARGLRLGLFDQADGEGVRAAIRANLEFTLAITAAVGNPFGHARQLVKALDGAPRAAFFMPHRNETGYWWQGENARLASLAAASRMAAGLFADDPGFQASLTRLATDQLDWILGCNPFDSCMVYGLGRNNAAYVDFLPNQPGGVCNGVTSGFEDESDIAFVPLGQRDNLWENWRWGEQWICHAAWYVLALALPSRNEEP